MEAADAVDPKPGAGAVDPAPAADATVRAGDSRSVDIRRVDSGHVDTGNAAPRLVIVTGLPGTGKSTLADRVARAINAPAFAGDWLFGALKPAHPALATLNRADYVAAWFGLLRTLATRQLALGQSAVVDDIVSEPQLRNWRETAEQYGARLFLVECICSDPVVHRARIESRVRGIPGWHEVGWDHVERMRREVPPLTADRLVLDAMEPLEDNLRRALASIAG